MRLLDDGALEPVKLSIHAAMMALSGLCALYNAAAFGLRGDPRLRRNAVAYLVLTVWEAMQVSRHQRHG